MAGLVVASVEQANGAPVLEIEVTANRPTAFRISESPGKSRRSTGATSEPFAGKGAAPTGERIPYSIEIHDPDLCPRYVGLLLDGIRVGPSPIGCRNGSRHRECDRSTTSWTSPTTSCSRWAPAACLRLRPLRQGGL